MVKLPYTISKYEKTVETTPLFEKTIRRNLSIESNFQKDSDSIVTQNLYQNEDKYDFASQTSSRMGFEDKNLIGCAKEDTLKVNDNFTALNGGYWSTPLANKRSRKRNIKLSTFEKKDNQLLNLRKNNVANLVTKRRNSDSLERKELKEKSDRNNLKKSHFSFAEDTKIPSAINFNSKPFENDYHFIENQLQTSNYFGRSLRPRKKINYNEDICFYNDSNNIESKCENFFKKQIVQKRDEKLKSEKELKLERKRKREEEEEMKRLKREEEEEMKRLKREEENAYKYEISKLYTHQEILDLETQAAEEAFRRKMEKCRSLKERYAKIDCNESSEKQNKSKSKNITTEDQTELNSSSIKRVHRRKKHKQQGQQRAIVQTPILTYSDTMLLLSTEEDIISNSCFNTGQKKSDKTTSGNKAMWTLYSSYGRGLRNRSRLSGSINKELHEESDLEESNVFNHILLSSKWKKEKNQSGRRESLTRRCAIGKTTAPELAI